MTTTQLIEQIHKKQSFLCIGLDVDLNKIPKHLLDTEDPIFESNAQTDTEFWFVKPNYKG